jgi:ferredoxin
MRNLVNGVKVDFCERCSSVCADTCRRQALRERPRDEVLLYRWRFA